MKQFFSFLAVLAIGIVAAPGPALAADYPIQDTPLSGGATTVSKSDHNAYSMPLANISLTQRLDFSFGNSFFRNPWVIAPSSTEARDGLGPIFNTNACQSCHVKDGRGNLPAPGEPAVSAFLRLSIPAPAKPDAVAQRLLKTVGVIPEPNYGTQLQNFANPGVNAEGRMVVTYVEQEVALADGLKVKLRRPHYAIAGQAYGDLHPQLLMSPRIAPPMIGLGLLEAIPEPAILAAADPEDKNKDGISGRPNHVWDRQRQVTAMGRFGWKAGQPNVAQQNADAFAGDMGLTSTLNRGSDCTPIQRCEEHPQGGEPEVADNIATAVAFYATSLAVPARRNMADEAVQRGAQVFNNAGCASCHTPRQQTGDMAERPDLSKQTIWPYSDLLLHDMGEELADHRPEFEATGREWRTPPLWGLGLAQQVNEQATFLHDGRARTLLEAILWHGGEATAARDRIKALSKDERDALLAFLNSL